MTTKMMGHAFTMVELSPEEVRAKIKQELSEPMPKLGKRHVPAGSIDRERIHRLGENIPLYMDKGNKKSQEFAPIPAMVFDVSAAPGYIQITSAQLNSLDSEQKRSWALDVQSDNTFLGKIRKDLYSIGCHVGVYYHKLWDNEQNRDVTQAMLCLPVHRIEGTRQDPHLLEQPDIESRVLFLAYLLKRNFVTSHDIENTFGASYLARIEGDEDIQRKMRMIKTSDAPTRW